MKGFILIRVFAVTTVLIAAVIGIALGLSLAATANIQNEEILVEFTPALPTKIFDASNNLITEYSADEKRELVLLSELPRHLIQAVLAREDPDFYNHRGFSVRGIARAVYGQLTGQSLGGGSTITQQVAGTLYTNRRERTISRKIRELWWALQMERRYTKNEILEIYLNNMIMGPGTYGVEASSQYFFDHSARDVSLAEAAMLVIQLSSPTRFNPLENPNVAMERQRLVLDKMVELGYATAADVDASFNTYWAAYDYTRPPASAYYSREDQAPWFSEYVRRELEKLMYGPMDYYRDGYLVRTTLDLKFQNAAQVGMDQGLERANREFTRSSDRGLSRAERVYAPIVNLLTLSFNLEGIYASAENQEEHKALSRYSRTVNPVVDMATLLFDLQELKPVTNAAFGQMKSLADEDVVEGALIILENDTGYIKAIIGGSRYGENNQYIRATQAKVMPGSSFKPLYYSAGIDSRQFTMATMIYDSPMVFYNEDGTPYIPLNFRGQWKGSVLLYEALAQSMNIPSLQVLDGIGFDAAINRAASLLGITDPEEKRRTFPRVYPMGLGIISVAPIQMARAFAIFANQGKAVTPMAIRTVEDRDGRVIIDLEREVRLEQRQMGSNIQVVSPQNAYIMTRMMNKVVEMGTLAYPSGWGAKFTFKDEKGRTYHIPAAGKTGTTQNWSDAWAVGFTPYYTVAIWFGFDKPGNSLGLTLTGAGLAGPIWADLMHEIHAGLPRRDFVRPSGIVDATVCSTSGLLRNSACPGGVTLSFLAGTVPTEECDLHGGVGTDIYSRTAPLRSRAVFGNSSPEFRMPTLPPELMESFYSTEDSGFSPGTVDTTPTFGAPNAGTATTPAAPSPGPVTTPGVSNAGVPLAPPVQAASEAGNAASSVGIELPAYNPLSD
ncbi:penicillin-binding protein [Spirochaetia bacterium]|nr:penicillin-binding protein [Spirochaetia bacterium]